MLSIPSEQSGLRRRSFTVFDNTTEGGGEQEPLLAEQHILSSNSSLTNLTANNNLSPAKIKAKSSAEQLVVTSSEQPLQFASTGTAGSSRPPLIPKKATASPSSVVDYAKQLHPTLLQHYYNIMSVSLNNNTQTGGGNGNKKPPLLPALAFQEVILGDIIGRGGFSFVHEIKYVKLQEIYDTGNEEAEVRAKFASIFDTNSNNHNSNSASDNSNNAPTKTPAERYVLKTLRPDLPEDEHNKGIIDLAVESQFLAALSHPNILSLRGHANSDPLESRYFVILDRLTSTLDHRLKIWRKDVGINMGYWFGPCIGYCCGKSHVIHRIWLERFTVARDIASAISYLHSQDIVYRDLKPDNIGFNSEGELKMFDFGLAKRITGADKTDDELYALTGNTVSRVKWVKSLCCFSPDSFIMSTKNLHSFCSLSLSNRDHYDIWHQRWH